MDTSRYMDKQITELSNSQSLNFLGDDDKQEVLDGDHGFEFNTVRSLHNKDCEGTSLTDWSSMECIDSAKFSAKKAGAFSNAALISEIDRKMKEHVDVLLHSVEFLSTRVSQLESKTHQIEDVVDDIKESLELNQGITDGKLREIKNILVEVQGGVQDLSDKQEIAEAQLQLAKLQMSKNNQQVEKQNVTGQAYEAPSSVSQQSISCFLFQVLVYNFILPLLVVLTDFLRFISSNSSSTTCCNSTTVSHQLLQNQMTAPSVPKEEPYNPPYNPLVVPTQDSMYQQYQLPQLSQVHPDPGTVNPYQPMPYTEAPYSPTHSISQPPGSNNGSSYIKPLQPIPSPPVLGGESIYKQLPTARLLPNTIPSASTVDNESGSGSGGSGNRIPADDVVDKVATMGFRRDLVRATVRKMTENGQSADLNAVLDKLMNG
uniref:DUF1421 domain-containing protein n=1 Tax=Salix viminalis TaxID=40686 RepID=A0A6N2MHV8_SALVM